MLHCSDGSYYTGVTNDYETRYGQHANGISPSCYTFKRRPLKLVYVTEFNEISEAINWEKKLKRWSRKKKQALINRDQEGLEKAAECKNGYHSKFYKIIKMYSKSKRIVLYKLLCRPSSTLGMTQKDSNQKVSW